ncbi:MULTISPECIES: hypothetical protein [unclassified Halomonas]|uniref:hypothetical protein n=1 Tax=unclassified Halomonas TaxID=2609666 RepID=UPI0020A14E47|nr:MULTISPECIES: hypothetical protein [unclassified Halomonas]MCP1313000.1 hypothetical protein [Halomonas sp. 707D7]MCP1328470.1 hypothetical protein [Halomonas sp. 707D4]
MLTDHESDQVLELVYATAEVLGQEIRPGAAVLIADDLSGYPFGEIRRALARCRAELHGKLTLAAIIDRLPSANAHLLPNEAWALALRSTDEQDTVVWTAEIARAFGVARPVLAGGDKVGARMAFLAAYEREVETAKAEGRQPGWQASLGHDPQRREIVLNEAVTAGKLPAPNVAHLLPPPEKPLTEAGKRQRKQVVSQLRDLINQPGDDKARARREAREQEEARRRELLEQAGAPLAAMGGR